MPNPRTTFGNKSVVKLDNGSGALTDISAISNSAALEQSVDTDGDLAFGERSDGHTIGLIEGGSIPLGGSYSRTRLLHLAGIWQASTTQTVEVNYAGTVATRRKATAETVMTSVELSCNLSGTSTLNSEHKVASQVVYSDN